MDSNQAVREKDRFEQQVDQLYREIYVLQEMIGDLKKELAGKHTGAKNKIREARIRAGFSQTSLASQIGMAEPTLSALETGKRLPWPKAKKDIASALNMREDELF